MKTNISDDDEKPPPGHVVQEIHLDLPKGAHVYFEEAFSCIEGGLERVLSAIVRGVFRQAARDYPQLLTVEAEAPAPHRRRAVLRQGFEQKSYTLILPEAAAALIGTGRKLPGGGIEATLSHYFTHAHGRLHEEDYRVPLVFPTRGRPRGSGRAKPGPRY